MTEASKHPHHWDLKFDDGSSLCPDCREGVCQCEPDMVNSPAHYGNGSIECIEYIEDFLTTEEYIGYLLGNIAIALNVVAGLHGKGRNSCLFATLEAFDNITKC